MSYCRQEGKDKIIFGTKEYLSSESNVVLLEENDQLDKSNAGAILENGDINWDCPCLGSLPNGPCGPSFREAFTCWAANRDSKEEFSENCHEKFADWDSCFRDHKDLYKVEDDDKKSDIKIENTVNEEIKLIESPKSQLTSTVPAIAAASSSKV